MRRLSFLSFDRMGLAPGMLGRAARTSAVVGTALTLVNHGGAVVHAPLTVGLLARIVSTFAVPFLVSLHAMLGVVPDLRPGQRGPRAGLYRCRTCGAATVVGPKEALGRCPTCRRAARWVPSDA